MSKIRRLLSIVAILALPLILSSCKLDVLNPKGPIAAHERDLLIDATLLMLLVVIPVILLNFWIAWHYRASNTKATYKPNAHHNGWIELVCWTIPVIIIAILATMTWISTHQLDPYRRIPGKGQPMVIQAVALNWKWLFIYPEQHIATVNYLQIPLHQQIEFHITSDAPMNSLAIPALAGQIYAMAGMQTKLHLIASHLGVYNGRSTNFSGAGFSDMKFKTHVTSRDDFNAWVNKVKTTGKPLTVQRYNTLSEDSVKEPVHYFSSVAPKLYQNIIMKFMMPLPANSSGVQQHVRG